MNRKEKETIIRERNPEIRGFVECGVCGRRIKVEPPYMYTVRVKRGIVIGDMLNFACSKCFKKQRII